MTWGLVTAVKVIDSNRRSQSGDQHELTEVKAYACLY